MKKHIVLVAALALTLGAKAQQKSAADSLMSSMGKDEKPVPVAIFKSTRLVLSQTTEMVKKNALNFEIIHRFGDIAGHNGGGETAYGIDRVNDVLIGFEYGITDNLNVDYARSTIGQLMQLELKWAVIHQMSDDSSPIAITLLGEAGVKPYQTDIYTTFSSRQSYLAQAVIARKFGSALSLQVSPTYVSENTPLPLDPANEKSFFAMQAAARIKVSNHSGFIVDYAHPFSSFRSNNYSFQDPLGFGYEVETGGHVFTLNVTNANSISEMNMLTTSQQRYSRGQYRIGFTISRMFDFNGKGKKEKEDK
ncbi:DUF5777 family beta-barrel protein [Mucilaginibacter sp. dw_454]|uniref:DUF5777 family beta-barrel protein n=1 Tax=Mucilaginibacter sp. dw_454 TaxID=2720079 RepID=UPI001BD26436|nr:DUF5777 family beta-barrel protein [Mucilaginibacter sp. dw_454]